MAGQSNTVVIASGGTVSASFLLGNLALVGVSVPSIDSATIALKVSSDGGATFQTLVTDSTGPGTAGAYFLVTPAATGNVYVAVNPEWTFGVDAIQLVSSATQNSARTFILHLRDKR